MAKETTTEKIELSDVMLAMDVVDTLRHQQAMVDRELNTETYDQALVEKVRKIYADQGLEVTDEIINRGVAALREGRFAYTPPKGGVRIALARIYVNRRRWTKVGAILLALVVLAWVAYRFVIVAPAQREQTRQTRQLTQVWEQFQSVKKSDRQSQRGEKLYQQARQALEAGKTKAAANAITQLTDMTQLPDQLGTLRAEIVKEAREKTVAEKADTLYRDAMAALDQGDTGLAQKIERSLQALYDQLKAEYTLKVVSRPETPSGIWRYPENNPKARNYYIIVEAVTSNGERLSHTIVNEEDGKAQVAQMWGIRVPKNVYDQISQDKKDNGIIDKNNFGIKRRGFLTPEYLYPAIGGTITKW